MSPVAIVFIVIIALALVVIVFVKPEKEKGDAIQRFRAIGLAELRKPERVPQLITIITGVGEETIFRMRGTLWFEALLAETFARPIDLPADVSFLTSQYVRYLASLREFMSRYWPTGFGAVAGGAEVQPPSGGAGAFRLFVLQKSLEWLYKVASDQNRLVGEHGGGFVKWESSLFESSSERSLEMGWGPQRTVDSYRFRITVPALEEEMVRFS